MKTISKTAVVAVMAATLGLGAVAPVLAQEASPAQTTPSAPPSSDQYLGHGFHMGFGMRHGGGLDAIVNVERGAEGIEVAIVRLGYRLDLTDEQKGLLDELKTAALKAANDFDAATQGLRPTRPTADASGTVTSPAAPDFATRLDNRIAMAKAHVAALEAVQPAAKAFYDSLTDEQKTQLATRNRGPEGMPGDPGRERGFGPRGDHHGMMGGNGWGMQGHWGQNWMNRDQRPRGMMQPDPQAPAAAQSEADKARAISD
jgi:hypothetical protein